MERKLNTTNNKLTKEQKKLIIQICKVAMKNEKMITLNTLECHLYEKTHKLVKMKKELLEEMGFKNGKFVVVKNKPTEEQAAKEKELLDKTTEGLINEMILGLDEIGYQLMMIPKKVSSIHSCHEKPKSVKLIFGRQIKCSHGLVCIRNDGMLLKPFTSKIPSEETCFKECMVGYDGNKNQNNGYYTKKQFKKWFEDEIIQYSKLIRIEKKTTKKVVVIMDEYFKQFVDEINTDEIEPFYLHHNTNEILNPVSNVINPMYEELCEEIKERVNNKEKLAVVLRFAQDKQLLLKKVIEYSQRSVKKNSLTQITTEPMSQDVIEDDSESLYENIILSQAECFENKEETNEVVSFVKHKNELNEIITIQGVYSLFEKQPEEIDGIIKKNFKLKTVFPNDDSYDCDENEINCFIRNIMRTKPIDNEDIIFFDVVDWRIAGGDSIESIYLDSCANQNNQMKLTRSSIPSKFMVGINGIGRVLSPRIVVKKEEITKELLNSCCVLKEGEYFTNDDIIDWVESVCGSLAMVDLKSLQHQRKVIVIHEYFKGMFTQIGDVLDKFHLEILFVPHCLYNITPLNLLIEKTITNLLLQQSIKTLKQIKTTTLLNSLFKTLSSTPFEIFSFDWNELRTQPIIGQSFIRSLIIKSNEELKNNIYLYVHTDLNKKEQPCNCFNLKSIPPFFRGAVYSIMNTQKFKDSTTVPEQKSILVNFGIKFKIDVNSVFVMSSTSPKKRMLN